jgi:hypothetical protein
MVRARSPKEAPAGLALALAALLPSMVACSSPASRAAASGDRGALRTEIERRERTGELTTQDAACLAREVADRDLRSASPDDARAIVRDLESCARELDDAFAERMRVRDAAGAAAALARFEASAIDADDLTDLAQEGAASDVRWRPLVARAQVHADDHATRMRFLVDPDPAVRRQAARAARDAADAGDFDALVETARLDPEPIVRTEAVRAIAAQPSDWSDRVANVLRDLWAAGDDGLREDIALAWASPPLWRTGGQLLLRDVVASEHGPGAIEAAAAVLRHRDATADIIGLAAGHIVRAVQNGSRRARLQAIAEAPLERSDVLAVVRRASADDDGEIKVAALSRLAAQRDAAASSALEDLAQPGSPVAAHARWGLAAAGDRRVQAWLEQDLAAPAPEDRLAAAAALATLGVPARAASLLADASASVRDRAACTIVMAARIRR